MERKLYTTLQYPLVDVAMLKLDKSCADGCDVALLARERHTASALGIPQLWVGVDTSIADATIETAHDQRQLHWSHATSVVTPPFIPARPIYSYMFIYHDEFITTQFT